MSGFHGAFATGVACQQGTLTLPDTWFRPPFWDLLMLQLLRPNSSNLPCLYSTFHLEYPLVLSRFCLALLHKLHNYQSECTKVHNCKCCALRGFLNLMEPNIELCCLSLPQFYRKSHDTFYSLTQDSSYVLSASSTHFGIKFLYF